MRLPAYLRLSKLLTLGAVVVACGGGTGSEPSGPGTAGSSGPKDGAAGWDAGDDGGLGGGGGRGGRGGSTHTGRGGGVVLVGRPVEGGASGSIGVGGAGPGARGGTGLMGGAGISGRGGAAGSVGGRGGAAGGGAGVGGRAGTGGRGGVGGRGGGTCGPTEPPTGCPGNLCGDGKLDSCIVTWGHYPFCYQYYFAEECDGTNLEGMTCESYGGFSSGKLRCTPECTIDTRDCSECVSGPGVVRCGVTPLPGDPLTYALAANDNEVALASVAYPYGGVPELSFTRLSPALDILGAVRIEDPAVNVEPDEFNGYGASVAVAPLPSGWVIAGFASNELFLHAVDVRGEDAGRTRVEKTTWAYPYFVPRPNGGPLLFWGTSDKYGIIRLFAAVVAADGLSMTTPIELKLGGDTLNWIGRGAFVDGTFYVPLGVNVIIDPADPYGYRGYEGRVRIARIGADGTLVGMTDVVSGPIVYQPTLAAGEGALHLTYWAQVTGPSYYSYSSIEFLWQRLDTTGAPVSPTSSLGNPQSTGPSVALGNDTIQMLIGSYPDSIALARVSGAGEVDDTTLLFAQATSLGLTWYDMVARGPDVVVGWQSNSDGRLRLARLKP